MKFFQKTRWLTCLFLFTLIVTAYAHTNSMPQYQALFTLPSNPNTSPALVLRYYQEWGDGSRTGWQTPVVLPTVSIGNRTLPIVLQFSYASPFYTSGAIELGYDQYAQYYTVFSISGHPSENLLIQGPFQQAAYMSATLYSNVMGTQPAIVDKQMTTLDNASNPYIEGNPSVFAYSPTLLQSHTLKPAYSLPLSPPPIHRPRLAARKTPADGTGEIYVYRLDQTSSHENVVEDITPDGCSQAYLYAEKESYQDVIIFRIKVPTTFIESDHPDMTFGHYQTRYFSVSAHRNSDSQDRYLTYWTVNTRMLRDYMDDQGYAYVFFASNDYTNNLAIEQHTPDTQPPVMTWGRYKGYVLGNPDFAIIMRYRDPDPAWQGSPVNATCYATPEDEQPVTKEQLGDYLPEIYGDTMENFQNGHIGAVNKDALWPVDLAKTHGK